MLRHYDSLGLVRPTGRTHGGYREYSGADIRRIFHVESLRSLGLSLKDVSRALDDPGFTPGALVDDLIRQTRERIAAQTELLTRLRRIGDAEPADWADVLQTVALLQALGSDNAMRRQRAALTGGELPVAALVEAALGEADPNVAGALRWALARSGDGGLPALAAGLDDPDAEVRKRAVECLAELDGEAATDLLRGALAHADPAVRRCAALALGNRGIPDAIPPLIDMTVDDQDDATDALSALAGAGDAELADQIATGLVARLAHGSREARLRLAQALADLPGSTAAAALEALSHDQDRLIAATASYALER